MRIIKGGKEMTIFTLYHIEKGYKTNPIKVDFDNNGSIHFCGDHEHEQVYLYPNQAKKLIQYILKKYKLKEVEKK